VLLTDLLSEGEKRWGERPALTMRMGYRTKRLSFAQVAELSRNVAEFLARQGVGEGDRVILLAPNSPYWICVFFSCLLRGSILVPLNVQSTGEFVQKIVSQTEAKFLFKYLHFSGDLPPHLPVLNIDFLEEVVGSFKSKGISSVNTTSASIVEILYTSGTTGDPKGVVLTQHNLCSNLEALSRVFSTPKGARFLSILPLSHSYEQMAGFLLPYTSGAEIIYAPTPSAIGTLLREEHITHLIAVPEFLALFRRKVEARIEEQGMAKIFAVLERCARTLPLPWRRLLFSPIHRVLGGRLGTIACGGAPLDPELQAWWENLGVNVLQGYGLTESSPVVTTNTLEERLAGSVGKPLPGVDVRLGEGGEVLVRGPNVFSGYFRDPERTREVFTDDEWFRTGDIGELDAEGFLTIRGRKKYMILGPGGQNVYPEDIEEVLRKIPGVRDACVLGIDRKTHVAIHAVLLFEEGEERTSERAVAAIEEANRSLASFQSITEYSFWGEEDFPRSATRKVQREKVLSSLAGRPMAEPPLQRTSVLTRLLAEVTGVNVATIGDSTVLVRDLGLDSLLRIELLSRIEERFGREIAEARIDARTTVADLEQLLRRTQRAERSLLHHWPYCSAVCWLRFLLQVFLFSLLRLLIHLRVDGREHLRDASLPFLLMPNHVSYLDSLALTMALPLPIRRRLAFAAARDVVYGEYRWASPLLELLFACFPFPRQEGEDIRRGFETIGRLLDRGWSVVVFPEGRVSPSGQLLPLKGGAGLLATTMGVPIIPVFLRGTEDILPLGRLLPRKTGRVTVTFGPPLVFARSASALEATGKIQAALQELSRAQKSV
jgi:long-chain acyl-CoA synthetase